MCWWRRALQRVDRGRACLARTPCYRGFVPQPETHKGLPVLAFRDRDAWWAFLAEQPDLSPKAWPSSVRILDALPRTATNKVLRRELRDLAPDLGVSWTR